MVLWPLAEEDEDEDEDEEETEVNASSVCELDLAPDLSSLVLDSADAEEAAEASADERAATAAISAAVMGTRMRPLGSDKMVDV